MSNFLDHCWWFQGRRLALWLAPSLEPPKLVKTEEEEEEEEKEKEEEDLPFSSLRIDSMIQESIESIKNRFMTNRFLSFLIAIGRSKNRRIDFSRPLGHEMM